MDPNHVGVVGLGGMGKALAESLIAAEHPVAVWDRHTDRVATTAMIGAAPSVSPRQLAEQSNVIFIALPNPAAVREVLYDEETGVLAGLCPEALIVDMTTGDPELAQDVAQRVAALGNGARYVDAPVSGKAPNLTVMIGGQAGVLGSAEPIVEDVAAALIYTGALGDGFATKLVHQHVKYATHLAVAEALVVAQQAGLELPTVIDALERSSGVLGGFKGVAEYYSGNKRAVAKHAPATTIAKDMRLASALADSMGVTSVTLAAATEFFGAAADGDYAKRPYPESTELLTQLRTTAQEN
ncbi:NAD(P)-dependent oxidoreductase [Pseudarthrobacter enclensis]|uniref:3-hydroxyisobutyrate dehydrogenase-like beta-hydroxyacid dehydrogenase n=1 Tax=Pseudarthrobacter enclensis TaxID=993070 RepID=A0ABT9RTW8_9MICC|nr:NAD(P)-dependent oxidoreductase [Pseudarthrobacter enclensis]MDP9888688.1 3-hydroxyisobutyrate dehydrogenase-like beta-hydroxyacid dehydrogenase [Pseudarthrobacter enclensis]